MKILGHIHTFNDEAVIDRSLGALLSQSRPPDEILIVDNASTDGTLRRPFPAGVTVVRNPTNVGTSGAVHIGLRYAMDHGFDWAWIMDGDSAPFPDALEKLVELWQSLPEASRRDIWRLSSLPLEQPRQAVTSFTASLAFFEGDAEPKPHHGHLFGDRGYRQVIPDDERTPYACDATIWAGCLFRLEAVRDVGLPAQDYVLDCGEYEYGYRGKLSGYRGLMHQESRVLHNIRGRPSFDFRSYGFGPLRVRLIDMAPLRCYYTIRNMLYFWVYEFRPLSPRAIVVQLGKLIALTLNFAITPVAQRAQLIACLRGFRDGMLKNMDRRY